MGVRERGRAGRSVQARVLHYIDVQGALHAEDARAREGVVVSIAAVCGVHSGRVHLRKQLQHTP